METVLHREPGEFARLARPLLDADPARHTVALTVLDGLVRAGESAPVLLTLHEGREVVGAALRTPRRPAVVSAVPVRHATAVAELLARVDADLPGVSGPVPEAEAVAAAYVTATGARPEVDLRTRLFVLDALRNPAGVPGGARRAGADDVGLLGRWRDAFVREELHAWTDPLPPEEVVARSLRLGAGEMVWQVDGTLVSQATARPVVAGMSRIGPVYTPPEHRRRGYGAAVTAAATAWALEAGAAHVVLFTDAANDATNRLYPRVGYRPVHDAVDLAFRR